MKSPHENALPLIMTHGWPGSVIELLEVVGPLTDPTAHGGRAEDAFDLVLPSLPGYGFSGEPTEVGWDPGRVAHAWAELMHRLGYTRYVAQGGDVGASVTDAMGAPGTRRAGRHPHQPARDGAGRRGSLTAAPTPRRNARRPTRSTHSMRPASATSWSRPRGRRRSATPCWIHPSPWRPGCSTTTRTATRRSPAPLSTGSRGQSHPGPHRRQHHAVLADGHRGLGGPVVLGERTSHCSCGRPGTSGGLDPGWLHHVPGEIFQAPRSWVEKAYPNLTYFNEADKGGHFAAWEEPELFANEVRAAFRSLR